MLDSCSCSASFPWYELHCSWIFYIFLWSGWVASFITLIAICQTSSQFVGLTTVFACSSCACSHNCFGSLSLPACHLCALLCQILLCVILFHWSLSVLTVALHEFQSITVISNILPTLHILALASKPYAFHKHFSTLKGILYLRNLPKYHSLILGRRNDLPFHPYVASIAV